MIKKNEKQALQRFKTLLLKQFGSHILGVRLFGSKARGDDRANSDIDVLVITRNDNWNIKKAIGRIATTILVEDGIYISVKVLGRPTFKRLTALKSPFLRSIAHEGMRL